MDLIHGIRRMLLPAHLSRLTALLVVSIQSISLAYGQVEAAQPDQIAQFISAITDPETAAETKKTVAEFLISLNTPEAANAVIELTSMSAAPEVRRAILAAFITKKNDSTFTFSQPFLEKAVPLLIDALGDPDPIVQSAAASLLSGQLTESVLDRLATLATDEAATTTQRLAAIETLANEVHRFDVARVVVKFLDIAEAEVPRAAMKALSDTIKGNAPADVESWKGWWKAEEAKGELVWLRRQTDMLHRTLESERRAHGNSASRQLAKITSLEERVRGFMNLAYNLQADEAGRDSLIVGWLTDPSELIRQTSMVLIRRAIAEHARMPSDAVKAALKGRLEDPLLSLRQQTVQLFQATRDPAVAPILVERIPRESDETTRRSLVSALGQLSDASPATLTALATVIEKDASMNCIAAAAASFVNLYASSSVDYPQELKTALATAIRTGFDRVATADAVPARAATLESLVLLAPPELSSLLEKEIASKNPQIQVVALKGVARLSLASTLVRVRELSSSENAGVRVAASICLGVIGSEDADLELLLPRMLANSESEAGVREQASTSFAKILGGRSLALQLPWLQRLNSGLAGQPKLLNSAVDSVLNSTADSGIKDESLLEVLSLVLSYGPDPLCTRYLDWLAQNKGSLDGAVRSRLETYLANASRPASETRDKIVRDAKALIDERQVSASKPGVPGANGSDGA